MKQTKLAISHVTALGFWYQTLLEKAVETRGANWVGTPVWRPFEAARTKLVEHPSARGLSSRDVRSAFGLAPGLPVTLLVTDPSSRAPSRDVTYTTQQGPLPAGALCAVESGALVASPEYVFVQLAHRLSPQDAVELGFMLCGTYVLCDWGDALGCPPLTDFNRLAKFVERAGHIRGIQAARRALRHILDKAASPKETHASMMMCLPCAWGGECIPHPILNRWMKIGSERRAPDFFWPDQGVVGEYYGAPHADMRQMGRDAIRDSLLKEHNYKTFVLTNEDFKTVATFDAACGRIRNLLGKRAPENLERFFGRRAELHRHLLGVQHDRRWLGLFTHGDMDSLV